MQNLYIYKFFFLLFAISMSFMSSAITEKTYITATGEKDGMPIIYRAPQSVPEGVTESSYPNLLNIYWPFHENAQNGMPDSMTNEMQIEFEDAIISLDTNGVSHLMLVVTGNGRKEWIWYVKDVDVWMASFNQLLAEKQRFPIEIEIGDANNWATYHEFIGSIQEY